MLYAILKPIVAVALRLYFRRINRDGLEHIDNGRPTLILANHTASFMDAILVACFVKRRVHFFARGDVFENKLADKILRSIGLLPVYRLSEGRDKLHLNDSSNDEALKILANGGAVLIFCEGVSDIAKRLKPLKKGPFRLAANAAASLPEAPVIVPLGINYVTPTAPGGDVFLEGGAAMATADFIKDADEAALAKGATEMMRATAAALENLLWDVLKSDDEPAANRLLLELQNFPNEYCFDDTQQVISRLNHGVSESTIEIEIRSRPAKPASLLRALYEYSYKLPSLFNLGYAFHLFPLWLAKKITQSKVTAPDFYAPVFLSVAIILMIVWYVIMLTLGLMLLSFWWALALLGVLAASGLFSLELKKRPFRLTR